MIAAVIPIKPLSQCKSRLAQSINSFQRTSLTLGLLNNVLQVSTRSSIDRVFVLGTDSKTMALATKYGADWISDTGTGLNGELGRIFDNLSESQMASIYIAGDLPFLTESDIGVLIKTSGYGKSITLCPAAKDEGTNGILVPPGINYRPLLGNHSFPRHVQAAEKAGLRFEICNTYGWSMDLDSPEDLITFSNKDPDFASRILNSSKENIG